MQEENIFDIGEKVAQLRAVHPRLVPTTMALINRAMGRTIWVRTPDEVRDLYSAQYPELTTAAIDGPEYSGEVMRFKFVRAAGAKGSHA